MTARGGGEGGGGVGRVRVLVARCATTDVNPFGGSSARSGHTPVLNPFPEPQLQLIVCRH